MPANECLCYMGRVRGQCQVQDAARSPIWPPRVAMPLQRAPPAPPAAHCRPLPTAPPRRRPATAALAARPLPGQPCPLTATLGPLHKIMKNRRARISPFWALGAGWLRTGRLPLPVFFRVAPLLRPPPAPVLSRSLSSQPVGEKKAKRWHSRALLLMAAPPDPVRGLLGELVDRVEDADPPPPPPLPRPAPLAFGPPPPPPQHPMKSCMCA